MNSNIIGMRPPEGASFHTHYQWTGENQFLSPPEVKMIREHCDKLTLSPGTIGNGGLPEQMHENKAYRQVETCGVNPHRDIDWLYDRILQRVRWANEAADGYRFDLSGLSEPIGYLKYTAPTAEQPIPGHYNWHQDFGGGLFATRKLSLIIQLSDPTEYKGCRLMLCNDGPWEVPYDKAGDAILFPSWTPHCVTNIEEGVRRALVIWVHGPRLR